jgi:signal transduction histidine kinase/CheY-like chemotaxis protein
MPRLALLTNQETNLASKCNQLQSEVIATNHELEVGRQAKKISDQECKHLQRRLQRAEQMEVLGTLAAGVAHDLNNVLSGCVSLPDIITEKLPDDSPHGPLLTQIKDSGMRAAAIVADLLTLSRRAVVVEDVVDVNKVIAGYLKSPEYVELCHRYPNVTLMSHLTKGTPRILGSTTHIMKTVMNLVTNAYKATSRGGHISITTELRPGTDLDHDEVKNGKVIIRIRDDGVGISAAEQAQIFEPFYTRQTNDQSGTGLGMAIVWGVVQDHGGEIRIESQPDRGTTFEIELPATDLSEHESSEWQIEDCLGNQQLTVLVIDDLNDQREIARALLERLGYSVVVTSSGLDAINWLKTHSADVLLLDMLMGTGIDGYETYKHILKFRPDQRAVIASGYSENDRVRQTIQMGASTYLKKPYILRDLGSAIHGALHHNKNSAGLTATAACATQPVPALHADPTGTTD